MNPIFSFGVIADAQYGENESWFGRYFKSSYDKLRQCVETFNHRNLVFVIQLGDLIDQGFSNFSKMLTIYNQLKCPRYHIIGNHDYWISDKDKPRILSTLNLQKGYYDFIIDKWRFIVLDGNDISFHANEEKSDKYYMAQTMLNSSRSAGRINAEDWNGGTSPEQLFWFEDILTKAEDNIQKVIIFCHYPIYPDNIHNLWNDRELLRLIERYDHIIAFFSGHNHPGNYAVKKGVHYLTFQAMVDTPDQNAYAIVHVYEDYLKVEGFGREKSRVLPVA